MIISRIMNALDFFETPDRLGLRYTQICIIERIHVYRPGVEMGPIFCVVESNPQYVLFPLGKSWILYWIHSVAFSIIAEANLLSRDAKDAFKTKKIFESNEYFKKNRIDESKEFLIVDTQIAFDSASPTTFKHVVKKIAISENYDFIQESNRKTVDLTDLTHLGLHRLVALSTAEEAEFGYLEKISF